MCLFSFLLILTFYLPLEVYILTLSLLASALMIFSSLIFDLGSAVHVLPSFYLTPGGGLLLMLVMIFSLVCLTSLYSMGLTNYNYILFLMVLLGGVSGLFFISSKLMNFYIFFEFSLIPIFLIILGWGYQTERLAASKALFFYTFSSSLPFLYLVIYWKNMGYSQIAQVQLIMNSFNLTSSFQLLFNLMILLGFLVKLPMFMFHMWLPKAHVEAPVVGSMFLAAILLKLGGWGLIQFMPLAGSSTILNIIYTLSIASLIFIPMVCVQALDLKIIIAASSVAHMGMGLVVYFFNSTMGTLIFLWVLLSHGLSSSLMFYMSFLFYKLSNSRSLILTKGTKSFSVIFWAAWFMSCISMMGGPPSLNLWVEILSFMSAMVYSKSLGLVLATSAFLTGAYAMVVFAHSNFKSLNLISSQNLKFNNLEKTVISFHILLILTSALILAESFI